MRADGSTAFHADPPAVISSVHEQPVVRRTNLLIVYFALDISLPNSHRQPLNLSVSFGIAAFERWTWQAQEMISHGQ